MNREEKAAYNRRWKTAAKEGRPTSNLVDADPVRRHVMELRSKGMGWKRIADAAGVSRDSLSHLLYGAPSRGHGPAKRIHIMNAKRILAVQLDTSRRPVLVDAERARRHVRSLMEAGLGWRRIAELAGVGYSTVGQLLYGDKRSQSPRQHLNVMTETRLLAVSAELDSYRDRVQVDGAITRRKLEALIALGWSMQKIAIQLDLDRGKVGDMLARPTVTARRARQVRALYEMLWNTTPPMGTSIDRKVVTQTLRMAEARGYRRPMDWVDIEDLGEQPVDVDPDYVDEVAVRRVVDGYADVSTLTRAEKRAAAQLVVKRGVSPSAASALLHMSYDSVKKAVAA